MTVMQLSAASSFDAPGLSVEKNTDFTENAFFVSLFSKAELIARLFQKRGYEVGVLNISVNLEEGTVSFIVEITNILPETNTFLVAEEISKETNQIVLVW